MSNRPNLREAKQRTARAAVLFMSVDQLLAEFRAQNANVMIVKFRRNAETQEPEQVTMDWNKGHPIPSIEISLLLGEDIYHLRTAVEYVAYNLAWLDSGSRPGFVQFPIESEKRTWLKRRKTWLKAVNDEHVGMISKYQPWNGCSWTRRLQKLSNQDKHSFLHAVARQYSGDFKADFSNAEPITNQPGWFALAVSNDPPDIVLDDGSSIAEIGTLTQDVGLMLVEFQGAFGERDELNLHRR